MEKSNGLAVRRKEDIKDKLIRFLSQKEQFKPMKIMKPKINLLMLKETLY